MLEWTAPLRYDPLPPLLESGNLALRFATRRELLDEGGESPRDLWSLKQVSRLVAKQLPNGAWKYPGGGKEQARQFEDYDQIETFRILGRLVENYAATKALSAVEKAAGFLLSRQTEEGDFRGIYGRQYTPNYTGAILELLVKGGFGRDRRVAKAFRWLLSTRQEDGGWAIPLSTVGARWDVATLGGPTLQPDLARPFSHMATGMVLRAFASHPVQRRSPEALQAGKLLASRLFRRDVYSGRDRPEFWTKFSFPFWFTDLLSALDSLTLLGLGPEIPQIQSALDWFAGRQKKDGTWDLVLLRSGTDQDLRLWVGLAICRVFKRISLGTA
jgi:hypothetical protein